MYNLLLALLAGVVTFGLVALWLGPVPAVFPAIGVLLLALFLLSRRTGRLVTDALAGVAPLLQQRRIDEAETKLVSVKEKYGPWQFLLAGQIDAQLGMIDYLQLKWDSALPKLESGRWRNTVALVCIGAIHYRQGRKDEAWKAFAAAANVGSKDVTVYYVWATLLARDGLRTEALAALDVGLKELPGHAGLKELHAKIANKKRVDTKAFGESWYQYFPEELAQQMAMRGTRGPSPLQARMAQQAPRPGARHAPRR
jgi:tetratricopeptide (TPR) repeat protein